MRKQVLKGISSKYSRPLSVLGGIARVLGVGENAAVGFLRSQYEDVRGVTRDPFSPWAWMNAATGVDNFVDVARAVRDNETYEKWIEDSHDPGSFLYRNKMVIGLGLSIFGDPTTYLSFGVTGASKVAAQKVLVAGLMSTADEASTAMKIGKIVRTGEDVGDSSYDEVFSHIHAASGRPDTVGDALEKMRMVDKGGAFPDLTPEVMETFGIKMPRTVVGRQFRKTFARGGQGIRFAGAEIPGTRGLGGRIIEATPFLPEREVMRQRSLNTFRAFIPKEKLLRVQEDRVRAVAMAEFPRATQELAFARYNAFEDAVMEFVLDPVKANAMKDAPYMARAEMAIRNWFDDKPLAVPTAARKNLFTPGMTPSGTYGPVLKDLRAKAYATRDELIKQGEDLGLQKRQLDGFMNLWDDLVTKYDDPVDILARWQSTVMGTIGAHKMIDQLVKNPLLARPLVAGADELTDLEDEAKAISERFVNASKRANEKGISARSKAARQAVVSQLQKDSADVTARINVLHGSIREATKAGGEGVLVGGVRTADEARVVFGEDAVPFKWKGKTYMVPAPLDQALQEFRNPKLLDHEFRRMFRAINYTQNKWKIAATSLNPSFWAMNMVGGMWNNLLGGVYNPASYIDQQIGTWRQRLDRIDDTQLAGRLMGQLGKRVDPDKLARDRMLTGAYDARHAGGGFVSHEVHPATQEVKRKAAVPSKKGKLWTAARRIYAGTVLPLAVAPDNWVPDEIEDSPLFNPLLATGLALPELSRGGRYITQEVETSLRETPMRVAARDPAYYQLMHAMSVMPPTNFGKWMGQTDVGKDAAMREVTWNIGASMALRYQFDYTDLTNFERYVAKTIFPFYVFNKNNFVLQTQELINRPRFVATAMDIGNFMNSVTETEQNQAFQELLPEYFDKLGMFRIPVPNQLRGVLGLPDDQDIYLNPKLPYASLNLMPALWQIFQQDTVTPTNYRVMQAFSPIFGSIGPFTGGIPFKPLLEYSVGYNLGLARPIDYQQLESGGYRHSYREAPSWMRHVPGPLQSWFGVFKDPKTGHLMMNASTRYIAEQMSTPFMNSAGDVYNWGGAGVESDRNKANSFAFITGIRLTPVDPLKLQRGWLYRMRSFLEAEKSRKKERHELLPLEDIKLLNEVRASIRVVEKAYDQQQADLYGK